jgi:hypothetical protein
MEQLNVLALYLSQLTATTKPENEASVSVFTTRQSDLKTKTNVVVIINDHMQDLGVWAYRQICDTGFDTGSCTGTIKVVKLRHHSVEKEPGLVITNPGQYYYSHKEGTALTHESWKALPKKSMFHPTVGLMRRRTWCQDSKTDGEHNITVFDKVIGNEEFVRRDANISIIGIGEGGNSVMSYLNE